MGEDVEEDADVLLDLDAFDIHVHTEDRHSALDVVDDGAGVPPESRSKLFEPFFTTDPGGTGLGLHLAREICEANGAMLEYIEAAGGARFAVTCAAG